MSDTATPTDVEPTEDEVEQQRVSAFDQAFDEMEPEDDEQESREQPRDEQGRYASDAQDDEQETPSEAAQRRAFMVKLDHEEHEVDLDAMWADEEKRKTLIEHYQKGYGFDRAKERYEKQIAESKQQAYSYGRDVTLKWLDSQGVKTIQNPHTGQWEVVLPKQAATPAGGDQGRDATPDPAARRAELERLAVYGDGKADGESDPRVQINAIRELAKLDAMDAAAEKYRPIEEWRTQQQRQAQQAQVQQRAAQAEERVKTSVAELIEARAKSFDGPDKDRQIARLTEHALQMARTNGKQWEDITGLITGWADDLDARQAYMREQLTKKPPQNGKNPPPAPDGAPSGVSGQPPKGTKPKGRWTDDDWDRAIEESSR